MLVAIDNLDAFVTPARRLRNDCGFVDTLVASEHMRLKEVFNKNRDVEQYLDLFAGDRSGDEVQRMQPCRC